MIFSETHFCIAGVPPARSWQAGRLRYIFFLLSLCMWSALARAANIEPPPDPGFEASVSAADVIAEVEIVAGGPFRAVALLKKTLKGEPPKIFEIEGFNSYNWDTVHHGMAAGTRCILFLSRTEREDVFCTLTPAAPRFSLTADGAMVAFGDPPVRVPVKPAALEEGLGLLLSKNMNGKAPDSAEKYLRGLWEQSEIEPRYLAVEMAGALREPGALKLVSEASHDKLLKLRLRAVEALGKIGTPEAFAALRELLRDDKASVAREAARALALKRDVASLGALLNWVRKVNGGAAKPSAEQPKIEAVALEIIAFARANAVLDAQPEKLAAALLEIARGPGDKIPGEALDAAAVIAPATGAPVLIEMVLDRTFELRDRALSALQKIALKPVRNVEEFQAWWRENGKKFGEDSRRDAAEAAARGLAGNDDPDERRKFLEVLRNMPGAIGVVSASPLLVKNKESNYFSEDDLLNWNTPLAVPFLIERLGRDNAAQRRGALEALVALCAKNPSLRNALGPLLLAHLAERDAAIRRAAHLGAGSLSQRDALGALLDAAGARSIYEQQDAVKSIYQMSARTFGDSLNEPLPDQVAARAHLRGWWEHGGRRQSVLALSIPANPYVLRAGDAGHVLAFENLDHDAELRKLELLVQNEDSAVSEAAFAVLWREHGLEDPLWKKLFEQSRLRDRARGMLGALGAPPLANFYTPPLMKALLLLDLAAVNPPVENRAASIKALCKWLKGPALKEPLPLRRMAVLGLGLISEDAESLEQLGLIVDAALKAEPFDMDTVHPDELDTDYALMRSALVALCARADSTPLLLRLLEESPEARIRETAGRALSLRRERAAVPGLVRVLEKADRFNWQEDAHALEPLLTETDGAAVLGLLESSKSSARAGAVWILSRSTELGNDPKTRAKLIEALSDDSMLVRFYAAEALGKRKAKSALDALIKALDDSDDEVRAQAAQAIGEIGDRDACEAVVKAAPFQYRVDARWMKALAIAESAKYMDTILKFANSNMYMEQRAGMEALSASPLPAAKERLLKAFRNDDEPLQTVAADLLVLRGDGILQMLGEDLASKDKTSRARAYHLLSRVKTPRTQAALKAAFDIEEDADLKMLIGWALSRAAN